LELWNNQTSTKEYINKLIEFRQAVYQHGILARRDALFDLLDALTYEGPVSSFAMLSQSKQFQRKWPSLYAAVEDGEIDRKWLRTFLAQQVPQTRGLHLPAGWLALATAQIECWMTASMCIRLQ
jgi:hypothetical protein